MNISQWMIKHVTEEIFYIGYSNGYTFVTNEAQALRDKVKNEDDFLLNMTNIIANKKKEMSVESEEVPEEYRNGFMIALSAIRLQMLKGLASSVVSAYDSVRSDSDDVADRVS